MNNDKRKALGKYVDLRVIDGFTPRDAFMAVRRLFGHRNAVWAQKAVSE